MKNNDRLSEVVERSLAAVYGPDVAINFSRNVAQKHLQIPSVATLSRSRLMLDVLLCLHRQREWIDPAAAFIYLSMDSSPQNGLDYLMCLQDSVPRQAARQLMQLLDSEGEQEDDDEGAALESFLRSDFLHTTVLPLGIIASGNSGVAAKFECLFHSLKLEFGTQVGFVLQGFLKLIQYSLNF